MERPWGLPGVKARLSHAKEGIVDTTAHVEIHHGAGGNNGLMRCHHWPYQEPKLEVATICKAYFLGLCKGISPQNMAKNTVQYIHNLDPGIPIDSHHHGGHGGEPATFNESGTKPTSKPVLVPKRRPPYGTPPQTPLSTVAMKPFRSGFLNGWWLQAYGRRMMVNEC